MLHWVFCHGCCWPAVHGPLHGSKFWAREMDHWRTTYNYTPNLWSLWLLKNGVGHSHSLGVAAVAPKNTPPAIMANKHSYSLGWSPCQPKNEIILVVTGILGRGIDPSQSPFDGSDFFRSQKLHYFFSHKYFPRQQSCHFNPKKQSFICVYMSYMCAIIQHSQKSSAMQWWPSSN